MNKLFTKIVGAFLGLTMAVGVGVAVASGSKAGSAHAANGDTHDFAQSISVLLNNGNVPDDINITNPGYPVKQVIISGSHNKNATITATVSIGENELGSGSVGGSSWTTTEIGDGNSSLSGNITISFSSSLTGSKKGTLSITNVQLVEGTATTSDTLDEITSVSATITANLGDTSWTISNASATGTLSGDTNQDVTQYVDFSVSGAVPESVGSTTVSLTATPKDGVEGDAVAFTNSNAEANVVIVPYDYTFVSKQFSNEGTIALSDGTYNPSWTLSDNGGYYGYEAARGQQIGSGTSGCTSATLSTSSFSNAVSKITIFAAGQTGGSIDVTVGGKTLGSTESYSNTSTECVFEKTGETQFTGSIVISFTNTQKALYVKEIKIEFEETQTVNVSSIDLGNDFALAKGQTTTIVPTIDPSNATDQVVSYEVTSANPSGCVTVNSSSGLVTAVAVGTATITGTSHNNPNAADSVVVTVNPAIPTSLSWTKQNKTMAEGETLGSYFTASSNVLTVKYSDNTDSVKSLGDTGLSITLAETVVTSSYIIASSDNGKVLKATYTESGETVSSQVTLQVSALFSFESITPTFTDSKSYLLVDDVDSYYTVSYTSLNGQPTATATSSNDDVLMAGATNLTYDSENKTGTFKVELAAIAAGTAFIDLEITYGGKSLSVATANIVVIKN